MRGFGIFGAWVRSLLVGPAGFVLVYLGICWLVLALVRRFRDERKATCRPGLGWPLLNAALFLTLCLPYPAWVLEYPLRRWGERLAVRHGVPPRLDAAEQAGTAIVVFGGGVYPSGHASSHTLARINAALDLWRLMPGAAFVVAEGGIGEYAGQQWLHDYLEACGVPGDRIIFETRSRTTYQNARFTANLLLPAGYGRFVVVTSVTHAPRAWLAARRCGLNPLLAVELAGSRSTLTPVPTWGALEHLHRMLNEYVGIAGYKVLGWI